MRKSKKKHNAPMRSVFILSLTVLLGFGFFQLGLENVSPVWNSGIVNQIALVVMIFFLLIWLLGWVIFDAFESEDVDEELGHIISKPQRLGAYALGVLIAVSFAAMVIGIGNVAIFVPLMGAVVLGTSIGDHIVIKNLIPKITIYKNGPNKELINYYTYRPHLLLHCIQLFLIAVAGATYLFIVKSKGIGDEYVVYAILSLSIFINESVLWYWRFARMKKNKLI